MEFNDIYISVEKTEGYDLGFVNRTGLSGRYKYHSTKNNTKIFVQPESTSLQGTLLRNNPGEHFYLIYRDGFWYITNEEFAFDERNARDSDFKAFLRLKTRGTSNF